MFKGFHPRLNSLCRKLFPTCRIATLNVPTWTSGTEGLLIASIDPLADIESPHPQRLKELNSTKFRLYSQRMHNAAFALPQFLVEEIVKTEEKQQKIEL